MLTEIRDSLQQVGKRCEPDESDFHLQQATTIEDFEALEEGLNDEDNKRLLVRNLWVKVTQSLYTYVSAHLLSKLNPQSFCIDLASF